MNSYNSDEGYVISRFCVCVCVQNNSKSRWWIITKLTDSVNQNKIKNKFNLE